MKRRPLLVGALGGASLLFLYFGILSLANSPGHAVVQFLSLWPWLSALVFGFSLQLALYWHLRSELRRQKAAGATAAMATAGGISTGSMVACCAHHIADVLPFLGLSAVAVFLVQYQRFFLVLALASNLIGITILLEMLQRHGLLSTRNPLLRRLWSWNMRRLRNAAIVGAFVILPLALLTTACSSGASPGSSGINLTSQVDTQNAISIEVTPIEFNKGGPVKFAIALDTHSGSLDFDMLQLSLLKDDRDNIYLPISWEGPPPGGHHRSGVLIFPPLKSGASLMELRLKDIYGIEERIFRWPLP